MHPASQPRKQMPILKRRFLVKSKVEYYKPVSKKRDIRSLTLDDFRPPIALKPEFPKLRKTRQSPVTSMKTHHKALNDLHITGKFACFINKYTPMLQNNIGLDTDDITYHQESSVFF